jgi:hypothetical protein
MSASGIYSTPKRVPISVPHKKSLSVPKPRMPIVQSTRASAGIIIRHASDHQFPRRLSNGKNSDRFTLSRSTKRHLVLQAGLVTEHSPIIKPTLRTKFNL